nr:MAG TPA: hypothetical protein [Caudoviricetes sp.]
MHRAVPGNSACAAALERADPAAACRTRQRRRDNNPEL